jgi:hypothetical protein
MAAGQGFKTFVTGEVLTAGDVNGYLMQGINVFTNATARDAAITAPAEGQFAFTKDNNSLWYYDGAAWVASGAAGDIDGVTAGVGISGGGTSGTVTVTNSMATAIDAKGDLVPGTGADTFARLAVGANDTVLTADSTTATGLKWATPGGGAVKQIVTATYSTTVSTAGATKVDTGLTATITPSSSSSKILVFVGIPGFLVNTTKTDGYAEGDAYVLRGATVKQYGWNYEYLTLPTAAGTKEFGNSLAFNYVDSPATTSATTYKLQIASDSASTTVSTNAGSGTGPISMILMEV